MSNHRALPLVMCGLAVSIALSGPLAGAEATRVPVRLIFDTDGSVVLAQVGFSK